MESQTDYIRLILRWPKGQACRSLYAMRATADYYGWTKEFEIWRPKTIETVNGMQFVHWPGREGRGVRTGGKQLRVSRAATAHSNPAGLTNKFKVSNSVGKFDLAELAHFTQGEWTWMEDLSGKRLSRDHWAHIYESVPPRRRAGLVSV